MHTEKPATRVHDLWIPAIWAFSEATFFFIVPDVWLTRIALSDLRRALLACVFATIAAIAGGALMFALGHAHPETMDRFLSDVPGISPALVEEVREQVASGGAPAMLRGPLTGVPYKIYAVECGIRDLPLAGFVAWSIAARLPRFVLLSVASAGLARLLSRWWGTRRLRQIHAAAWVLFYVAYFTSVGW